MRALQMPSVPQVSPLVMALLVLCVLGSWGYWFYTSYQQYHALTVEREQVEARLYQARNAATENTLLREELLALNQRLALLSRHIPTEESLGGLGQQIDQLARGKRVKLEDLVRSTEPSGVEGVNNLKFPITAVGEFAQVYQFLDQMTRTTRVVRLNGLEITVKGGARAIEAKTNFLAYFQTGLQAAAR